MAIVATHLITDGTDTDDTSFNTASITPTSGRLLLVAIGSSVGAGSPNIPTLSGGSLSFTQIRTATVTTVYRLTLFAFIGKGQASTINIAFAGQTQTACLWTFSEFREAGTDGVNGNGGIVQTAQDVGSSHTSFSVTLGAFSSLLNATYGCVLKVSTNGTTPGDGFTELGEKVVSVPTLSIQSEWKNSNDTLVDGTFPGSGGDDIIAFGAEIKYQNLGGSFLLNFV